MARVLVIAPHMDDEVLGVGGTISRHVAEGDHVKVLFIANRVYNHQEDEQALVREEEHALAAKEVLGYQEVEFARHPDERLREHFVDVLTTVEKAVFSFAPEMVYLNNRSDPHQDHRAVFDVSWICVRSVSKVQTRLRKVVSYEIPSSTDQLPALLEYAFLPNYYVNIDPFLETKQQAMEYYETERRSFPHPRSSKGIAVTAAARGMESNLPAAEAFVILREEWP